MRLMVKFTSLIVSQTDVLVKWKLEFAVETYFPISSSLQLQCRNPENAPDKDQRLMLRNG